jgi:hypothetical protein
MYLNPEEHDQPPTADITTWSGQSTETEPHTGASRHILGPVEECKEILTTIASSLAIFSAERSLSILSFCHNTDKCDSEQVWLVVFLTLPLLK